jgi:hypothetical protein
MQLQKTQIRSKSCPVSLYLLSALLFLSVFALFGGYGLLADPTGEGLQLPVSKTLTSRAIF